MDIKYDLRRSGRKTLCIEIASAGQVIVRAPYRLPQAQIDLFLKEKSTWIEKNLQKMQQHPPKKEISPQQAAILKQKALAYLPGRVEYYSKRMGVSPTGLKITSAQKRFGSCSGKNSLCFSWRLMLYPPEAIDYVVVHELSHIRHHDHSPAFYKCIECYMPDYKYWAKLLKEDPTI